MARLTHVDEKGKARMVDVGRKRATRRRAVARGWVRFNKTAFDRLRDNRLAKGDAIATARLAGVQAAKRTDEWIPLCHTIPLDHLAIDIELHEDRRAASVTATASALWRTGVEMEALVAVSAACLTLYDMAKAVDRGITIDEVQLIEKQGGNSGPWKRSRSRQAR